MLRASSCNRPRRTVVTTAYLTGTTPSVLVAVLSGVRLRRPPQFGVMAERAAFVQQLREVLHGAVPQIEARGRAEPIKRP